MSMFHELMMRKKEIMYATIKGTLTENDGVFSGFSSSNYLALQQNFAPEGSWEVCIKIKTGATTTSPVRYFFGCWGTGNIVVGTTTETYFKAFISTNNGSSYNVTLTTTSAVSTETVYYVKLGFTGTKYYLEQSTDGVNFVGRAEYSSSAKISSYPVNFGKVYANDNIWNGEVDLNKSYIKIDNTKYKLQAVVGYTVVGSPTITDGVMTNMSSSNFVKVNAFKQYENFEFVIKINTGTFVGNTSYLVRSNGLLLYWLWNRKLDFFLRNTNNIQQELEGTTLLVDNTDYWIKMKYDGSKMYLFLSTDGINYTLENSADIEVISKQYDTNIGVQGANIFNGSIDLNNTYIKINNKLWFNGQHA